MSKSCFRDLWDKFGPFHADYFASDRSYRMKPFYARFASGESQGVDAFGVSWKKGKGFFHSPVGLLSRVVRKAEREREPRGCWWLQTGQGAVGWQWWRRWLE